MGVMDGKRNDEKRVGRERRAGEEERKERGGRGKRWEKGNGRAFPH